MGLFNSILKFQKKFDPLSYNISKFAGLVPDNNQSNPMATQVQQMPRFNFGSQVVPQQQPMAPARALVGAPRAPMPQMGAPGAPRALVGAPRAQAQATVNALRAPTTPTAPIV